MLRVKPLLLTVLFVFIFPAWAHATTYFSGAIAGDTVWTPSESPYVIRDVSIPAGASLTILPGTVVKVEENKNPFTVDGTLIAGDLSGASVVITSVRDDSISGDTNEDGGASVPSAGAWRTITVNSGASVALFNVEMAYGGLSEYSTYWGTHFYSPMIVNAGGTLTMLRSVVRNTGYNALEQSSGTTTIERGTFLRIGGSRTIIASGGSLALRESRFDAVPFGVQSSATAFTFGGNSFAALLEPNAISFSGTDATIMNEGGNSGEGVIAASISGAGRLTLTNDGLPYALSDSVPAGATLAIRPGVVIKVPLGQHPLSIFGRLETGDPALPDTEPVVITSWYDDSVAGDTNEDAAATAPAAGNWKALVFRSGSSARLHNTTIRYGGTHEYSVYWGNWFDGAMIENEGGDVTLSDSRLTDSVYYSIKQSSGTTTVTDSEITRNTYSLYMTGGVASLHGSSIHDNAYGLVNSASNLVDATGNWWGSASGPTHVTNPSGTGDRVSDRVDFSDWLTAWQATTTPLGCTVDCNSNVLFLPGLQASRLYEPAPCDEYGCTRRLWEPAGDALVRWLFLTEDGTSTNEGVHTSDVVDEAFGFGPNIYETFIDSMNGLRSEDIIEDWAAVPYDWRFSPKELLHRGIPFTGGILYLTPTDTPYIEGQLRRLAASSRTGRVTIVAHSYGGIIAKELLRELGDEEAARLVDRLILVASPQTGTPQAMGGLLHGFDQGIPAGSPFFLQESTARELGENMPSAYYLLPTARYFADVATPLATFTNASPILTHAYDWYGGFLNSITEMHDFLLGAEGRIEPAEEDTLSPNVLNATMLADAGATHSTLDAWTPPEVIDVIQIAGWGIDTLAGLSYSQKKRGDVYSWQFEPMLVEDGDGTVVVPSALAMDSAPENITNWWVNLKQHNFFSVNRKHADVLEVEGVRSLIRNTLTNTGAELPSYISLTTPLSNNEEKKLRFFLHSPLSLHLYDGEGNHTGISTTTGMIEHGISGAYYREFGEVKYISAPASTTLRLVLDGEASGFFDLKIEEVRGDTVVATTTFVDVPTSTSTLVTMDFGDGTIAGAEALVVDEDDDGTTDFSLMPVVGETVTILPFTYGFDGFLQPINDTVYHPEQPLSVFKKGSTIPVKFQLKSATGTPMQATSSPPLWLPPERGAPMSATVNESRQTGKGTTGDAFQWDDAAQQYIYHWSTKGLRGGFWYLISLVLDDGQTYAVTVGLR